MAISIYIQPSQLMLNKNPIMLGLQTDNQFIVSPTKASGRFTFTNFPANNNTIRVTIAGKVYEFQFKDDAVANPQLRQIKRNNTFFYGNVSSWILAEVIPVLNLSINIREYLDLSVQYDGLNYYLLLSAKLYGSDYDLTLNRTSSVISFATTGGTDPLVRENFKIYCEIYETRSISGANLVKVATLEAEPDIDGKVLFYLNRALVVEDNEHPTDGEYSSINAAVHKRYVIYYGEKFGSPVEIYQAYALGVSNSTPFFVLNGAVDQERYYPDFFNDYVVDTNPQRFLNLHPRKIAISREQPLWLYYFAVQEMSVVSLKAKLYKTDGTTSTVTLQTVNLVAKSISIFNTSVFNHSAIEDYEGLYKYDVWLQVSDEPAIIKSETITYLISEFEFEHNKYFLYRNSWGCYETIWCHGKSEYTAAFDFETANKYVPGSSLVTLADSAKYGASFERVVEVGSGVKGREDDFDGKNYRNYLVDFLNSEEVYEYVNGKLLPVELIVKDEPMGTDMETVYSKVFKYKYSFKNKGYTPEWL